MMVERDTSAPRIDVILGRCDDMRAEVYVRATGLPPTAEPPVVGGTLSGPESRLAITLPTAARLVDLGPGPAARLTGGDGDSQAALARSILTEPGYWTPELPHRYRLVAEVRAEGEVIAVCDRLVGLRRLGVRGRSLWLEGRRWVPRGVVCSADAIDPRLFRESLAAVVLDNPTEAVCAAADEDGVAIIARCGDDVVACCLRWAQHASVMLAVLPRGMPAARVAAVITAIRPFRGTMLVGLEVDGDTPPPPVPEGIDCMVMSLATGAVPNEAWREPPAVPVLASRPASGGLRERRMACDLLQADLAAWRGTGATGWDWAGFCDA